MSTNPLPASDATPTPGAEAVRIDRNGDPIDFANFTAKHGYSDGPPPNLVNVTVSMPTPGTGGVDSPLYAIRDTERLGEHYTRHVAAMTAEGLHEKSAIAAELAYRDAEIERLRPYEPMLIPSDFPREMAVKCARGFLARIVQSFDALNGESNYSVTEVQTANGRKYEVTVRRTDKPTPHFLRKKAEAERDALAKFKVYVHRRLDEAGIPTDPDSPHKAEGCRIGGRLDVVFAERDALRAAVEKLPKTADGVTVVPGMTVYYIRRNHVRWVDLYGWGDPDTDGFCSCWFSSGYSAVWQWSNTYSTQALAEAALARGPAAGETTDGGGKD